MTLLGCMPILMNDDTNRFILSHRKRIREYARKQKQASSEAIKFFVNDKEYELIRKKMEQMGTDNMSAYIRKMVIDGYVVKLELPELRELTSKMKRISNSENQIAKRLNETDNIYEADIEEIKKNQEEIYEGIRKILTSLSKIK